jgi:hypothetical protein
VKRRQIFITEFDKQRLNELVEVAEDFGKQSRKDLKDLIGAGPGWHPAHLHREAPLPARSRG